MSAFFVYHARSAPTGRLLARALGLPFGRASRARRTPFDVLIRWGTQERIEPPRTDYTQINSPFALCAASDKLNALYRFRDEGVPHPEFVQFPGPTERLEGVWLGRQRHGFGGRDIVVLVDGMPMDYGSSTFATKFIPNDREYRLHVYNGEVIRVQRKYLDFPEDRTSEYIKNYSNGYRFKTPKRELNSSRREAAVRAVEALGLTFGAVDLVVDHEGNEYVLEVNTAPKCSPLTARAYVKAMTEHLDELGVAVTPDYARLGGINGTS